jgi:hypothetical protein
VSRIVEELRGLSYCGGYRAVRRYAALHRERLVRRTDHGDEAFECLDIASIDAQLIRAMTWSLETALAGGSIGGRPLSLRTIIFSVRESCAFTDTSKQHRHETEFEARQRVRIPPQPDLYHPQHSSS